MLEIKQIRMNRGVTLAELARRTEIDAAHLSRIESGRTAPTTRTLARIANGLGVSISELFDRELVMS